MAGILDDVIYSGLIGMGIGLLVLAALVLTRLARRVESEGLVSLLPRAVGDGFRQPLFEHLRSVALAMSQVACDVSWLAMLVCWDLDERQRVEVLQALSPGFRRAVFQLPLAQLPPWPIRRLLLGRAVQSARRGGPCGQQVQEEPAAAPSQEPQEGVAGSSSGAPSSSREESRPDLKRKDSILEVVSSIEGRRTLQSQVPRLLSIVSTQQRILARKMAGSAVWAARSAASSVRDSAKKTVDRNREQVEVIGRGAWGLAADPQTQVAAAGAVGGALVLGTGCATVGVGTGGVVGTLLGILPAPFTLGLSIPIAAAMGASAGLCVGSAIGGTAGAVVGGTAGYHGYTYTTTSGTSTKSSPAPAPKPPRGTFQGAAVAAPM